MHYIHAKYHFVAVPGSKKGPSVSIQRRHAVDARDNVVSGCCSTVSCRTYVDVVSQPCSSSPAMAQLVTAIRLLSINCHCTPSTLTRPHSVLHRLSVQYTSVSPSPSGQSASTTKDTERRVLGTLNYARKKTVEKCPQVLSCINVVWNSGSHHHLAISKLSERFWMSQLCFGCIWCKFSISITQLQKWY